MNLAIPMVTHVHEPAGHWEVPAQDGAQLGELAPHARPDDVFEELIEMRYQQHLAQRALQEMFESGLLQALEI
jgi:hypothetical protein